MVNLSFFCRYVLSLIFAMLIISVNCNTAMASGFAIIEQSVTSLGNANAGGAITAEDATTVFFNPAGMTRLSGRQLAVGTYYIKASASFDDDGSAHVLGIPLSGGEGGEAGEPDFLYNLYYVHQIGERLAAGIGINSPFGLSTDYNDEWVGRYHATKSMLITLDINPSIAYMVSDRLSIGAGVSIQYLDAELSNAIDLGTLDALPPELGGFGGMFGLIPQASDGHLTVEGDSWGLGYNLGLTFDFTEKTRAGIAYRSEVRHEINGTADFSGVPDGMVAATGGFFSDTGVDSTITLPDSAALNLLHQINPQWLAMFGISWTGWSSLEELRIEFDSGQPDGVTTDNWEDTMRYALGLTYFPNRKLTLRGGISYDETPIPNAEMRTPRLPGENRISINTGLGYRFSEDMTFNVAYAHYFIKNPVISKDATGEDALLGGLHGTYDAYADILAVQLNWLF